MVENNNLEAKITKVTDGMINPCNSCVHRGCCKYTQDIQEEVRKMTIDCKVQSNDKVFELQSRVIFKCCMYDEHICNLYL